MKSMRDSQEIKVDKGIVLPLWLTKVIGGFVGIFSLAIIYGLISMGGHYAEAAAREKRLSAVEVRAAHIEEQVSTVHKVFFLLCLDCVEKHGRDYCINQAECGSALEAK